MITRGVPVLLIVNWRVGDEAGATIDVAGLGGDGGWRYVIDDPFGVA